MFKNLFMICLVITIVMSITITSFPKHISLASTDEVRWSPLILPTEGESGKWRLASGADTKLLTMTSDGTLYCYATPTGTTDTLFESTDGGLSWFSIGHVKDAIIAIATVPQDATTLYYATVSTVYRSTDGGNTFLALPLYPGSAGSGNIEITSIVVVQAGSNNLVAVSTRNTGAGQYGGVYLLDENSTVDSWLNTNIGNNDVYSVAFSPTYTTDRILIAVAGNEKDTIIRSKVADSGWGERIGDACLSGVVPVSASIVFPADYQVLAGFFFTLDTGVNRGGAYRITPAFTPISSIVTPLGVGGDAGLTSIDITSLAITGDVASATLIAGCAREALAYVSRDGGVHWTQSLKPPIGQSSTSIVIAPDFYNQQKAFAVTCGAGSGFSVSSDGGLTWCQSSLIDGKITSLVDFTFIPDDPESVLFLITHDGTALKYSLWRSQDGGSRWQRILVSEPPGIGDLRLVKGTGNGSLFLSGQSYGIPVIWSSMDNGLTFIQRPAPCAIDIGTFIDVNSFFIGGYNGSKGVVYSTQNGGMSYSQPAEVGARTLTSIALSPNYPQDRTILAGNTGGQVFISTNGGASFLQLGQQLPVATGTGKISLAFDHDYNGNNIVYAAVDTKTTSTSKERLFRFTVGQSTAWQSMYGSLPDNAVINQIAVTNDGTFYAVNGQGVVAADSKGGLLRSLSPASQPAFEITMRGLDETATLNGLWTNNHQLWSFDTKNNVLMTLTDTLTGPVILESPANGIAGIDTDVRLDWITSTGATEYEWQINDEMSFSSLPSGFSGTATTSATQLTGLKPSVTYYWKVRVTKPLQSPWSEIYSFTTLLGGANAAPVLSFPEVGSITVVNPVFQWQTVPGADRYELLVSDNTDFITPVVCCAGEHVLFANAWHCEISLDYDTTYFWKVKACTVANTGEWSAVSFFTTEPIPVADGLDSVTGETIVPPIATVAQQPQVLPVTTNVQLNIPNWVFFIAIALLVVIVVLLVSLIVVLRSRHL